MKGFILMLIVASITFSCTKDSSVSQQEQRGKRDRAAQVSLANSASVLDQGEDDVINVSDVSFGQGEGIYSNYSGYNVHATAHQEGMGYLQVFVDTATATSGTWKPILATSSNFVGAGGSVSGFDGFPSSSSVTRVYRAMLIAADGSVHYSSSVQVN